MKKLVMAVFFTALFPSISYSFDFQNCKVVQVVSSGNKNGHAQLDCTVQNRPYCATASNYVAFDRSTDEGKQYMTMVLEAFENGKKLTGFVSHAYNSCPSFQTNVARLTHLRMRH